MRLKKRTDQRGSSAMFVVVGVLLFIGLISSIYFVKIHGDQVRKDQAIATYDKQKADEKKTSTKNESTDVDKKTPVKENNSEIGTKDSGVNLSGSDSLPATGPESFLLQLIGIGLITVSASAYLGSRRNLNRCL